MKISELKKIDSISNLPSPDGPECPLCQSGFTYWISKPPEGQIGSGPYYFFCWYCDNEWSIEEEDNGGEQEVHWQ